MKTKVDYLWGNKSNKDDYTQSGFQNEIGK